jgi:hypothetical protein
MGRRQNVVVVDFRMTLSHTNQVTADWSERGGYMLARHGIHPAWANEALDDPDRLVITPDPASKSVGQCARSVGRTRQTGSSP